jgi:hypothetical protein
MILLYIDKLIQELFSFNKYINKANLHIDLRVKNIVFGNICVLSNNKPTSY